MLIYYKNLFNLKTSNNFRKNIYINLKIFYQLKYLNKQKCIFKNKEVRVYKAAHFDVCTNKRLSLKRKILNKTE